jgi:hypothetical protein
MLETMKEARRSYRWCRFLGLLALGCTFTVAAVRELHAGSHWHIFGHGGCDSTGCMEGAGIEEGFGTWYWLRSPEEERRAVAGIFTRYCVRCHGIDGRGAWDIPGIPNFTNSVWQSSRTDGQIARIIVEGRGAVMPPFRGTLSLEEAWAMARYLRTFDPAAQTPRPELGKPMGPAIDEGNQAPKTKPASVGVSLKGE